MPTLTNKRAPENQILIIDDEVDITELISASLETLGYQTVTATSCAKAIERLQKEQFALVLSDIHMPYKDGFALLEEARSLGLKTAPWVFISGNGDPDVVERACRLGAFDVIQKPFSKRDLEQVIARIESRNDDTLGEIMAVAQRISGVVLGTEKRALVETRLMRRARFLGLSTIADYFDYFKANRSAEVNEIISVVTTHTTEFFREQKHFDFLADSVFPTLVKRDKPIKIWSAASSTGEEAYSLAICYFEFLRKNRLDQKSAPTLEIIATDIDHNSVETARKGIYEVDRVRLLNKDLVGRYFDIGTGSISHLVRIKDLAHRLCHFAQANLLASPYPVRDADIIFLRNVLIYFKSDDVKKIAFNMESSLATDGMLFLGHSESISNLGIPVETVGNSVYQTKRRSLDSPAKVQLLTPERPLRVLIVDDSSTIRKMLRRAIGTDHGFEVVGEADNPLVAKEFLSRTKVDVITLDIHMPEMDGITYLKSFNGKPPAPVVIVSSVGYEEGLEVLKCFDLGAADYIEKPQGGNLTDEAERIRAVLRAAAAGAKRRLYVDVKSQPTRDPMTCDRATAESSLLLIGASTGGIEAIRTVLAGMPAVTPPICIVQHLPAGFSRAFAARLNDLCRIKVAEAANGDVLKPSTAYIAPGGTQMRLVRRGVSIVAEITDDAPVNRHKPSVSYLFHSAESLTEHFAISAALLTGMGDDGADGLKILKARGAFTIAQDEETSVVFGMPKAAIALDAAHAVVPLPSVAYHLLKGLRSRRAA